MKKQRVRWKMIEEINNEIDETTNLMNLMNIEMDEEMNNHDVYEKTNRINKKIDVVNKIGDEIDDMVYGMKKRIKIIDKRKYELNNIDHTNKRNGYIMGDR